MKIAFALAVHKPEDDRVWHQQAQALIERKHEIFIISATVKTFDRERVFCFDYRSLSRLEQAEKFCDFLSTINPDIVVCDNPVSILGAKKYKNKAKKRELKIYYDITEYYPSKIHFHHTSTLHNVLKFPLLCGVSLYTALLVSGFIFGEHYKALFYRIFFWKRSVNLSYYADLKHIKTYPLNNISENFIMFFAGKMNREGGFESFIKAAKECAKRFPDIAFTCRVISVDVNCKNTEYVANNLMVKYLPKQPFSVFCEQFGDADLFFDLRKTDFENSHCLPIKLFYYMAAGRPVIYSKLKAIKKGLPEIDKFGVLVNPDDTENIVSAISKHLFDRTLYQNQCKNARQLSERKYNWDKIKKTFVDFIEYNR